MVVRFASTCALASFVTLTVFAADDPFCGRWKLNQEKSKFSGHQTVIEELGQNKFKFTVGTASDTVVADGTDQPMHSGETMSLAPGGPNALRMVIKKDGKIVSSMIHSLSEDGGTQRIRGTGTRPDGSTSDFDITLKRVGGNAGWSGTWESTALQLSANEELVITPYGDHGLTFFRPEYKQTLSMNFDGQEFQETGGRIAAGSTASGQRVDAHRLEINRRSHGTITEGRKYEVSPDGRTLTVTLQQTGQSNSETRVFDKISH